jgi:peptidoglycan glycosyltransferase
VLVLVSKPYCAPGALERSQVLSRCRRDPAEPLTDRVTQLTVPPGSAFKIVTLSAALDTRTFSLGSEFSGADVFGPSPYFDNVTYPSNVTRSDLTTLTLAQALAFSDNFTFAHIGLTLGASTFLRYAHRFLLGRHIPFELPVKPSVVAAGKARPSRSALAQSSFGAATDRVTPLQMALIASAVANHGTLMTPHLLRELRSPGGVVQFRYAPRVLGHVMSSRAARDASDAMVFVVDHGSGYRAQIAGVKVAGKTGTAASGGSHPHAWFIAFAPAAHPVIAVAVLHEFSGEGFEFAAPIARAVMVAALQEHGYRVR